MRGLSTKSCQVVNVGLRGHKQWWNLDPLSIARRPVVVGRGGRREAGGCRSSSSRSSSRSSCNSCNSRNSCSKCVVAQIDCIVVHVFQLIWHLTNKFEVRCHNG